MTRFHNLPDDQLYNALVGLRASPCFEHLIEFLEREKANATTSALRSSEPVIIYRQQGKVEELGRLLELLTKVRP